MARKPESQNERELGYLCVFEDKQKNCFVLHQYAPNRVELFAHLRGMMLRGPYQTKMTDPFFMSSDYRLVSVTVADFIPFPDDLKGFAGA